MHQCSFCKRETFRFDTGVPICETCAEERGSKNKSTAGSEIHALLLRDVTDSIARADEAAAAFRATVREVPSGLPHPDGGHRLANASRESAFARRKVMDAQSRLHEFLVRGTIPSDLKRHLKNDAKGQDAMGHVAKDYGKN